MTPDTKALRERQEALERVREWAHDDGCDYWSCTPDCERRNEELEPLVDAIQQADRADAERERADRLAEALLVFWDVGSNGPAADDMARAALKAHVEARRPAPIVTASADFTIERNGRRP